MSFIQANRDRLILSGLAIFAFTVTCSVTLVEGSLFLILLVLLADWHHSGTLPAQARTASAHPLFWPWVAYLGVCLLTGALAIYPAKALGQFNSDLIKCLCLAVLLASVRKHNIPVVSHFYTASAAISGAIGLWRASLAVPGVSLPEEFRARAFMNAVRYGEVMAIALLFIVVRLLYSREGTSRAERVIYWVAGIPVFLALVASQTRGAYLGFAVGVFCLFLLAKNLRLKVLGLAAALMVTVGLTAWLNPHVHKRLTGIADTVAQGKVTDNSMSMRLEFWKLGVEIFQANPVFGIGPDNVKPAFHLFRPGLLFGQRWSSLHNLYLHQAAERGLVGAAALLFLFVAMLLFALRNYRAAPGPFTLWAACVLPAFYAMNLTEISFQHIHTSFMVFLALAFSAAYSRPAGGQ